MTELAFAEAERSNLRGKVRASWQGSSSSPVQLAQDVIQYHILQGLAVTAGSAFDCGVTPPGKALCEELFRALPSRPDNQEIPLHVGGKAFTKHCHRDSSGWWGESKGTTSHKNALAETCFERIWEGRTWSNLFWLPHNVLAYEVRVAEGYGMRFQSTSALASNSTHVQWAFRGFVEPVTTASHDTQWRH